MPTATETKKASITKEQPTSEVLTFTQKMIKSSLEIEPILKNSENPYYNSKYFDINQLIRQCKKILLTNGLLLTQPLENGCVVTVITDGKKDLTSSLKLPDLTDPQKLGSCITYYRRYTLESLLALEGEDDDGNKAAGKTSTPQPKPAEPPKPPKPQLPPPLTEVPTLTEEQFKKAFESDAKGITATLKAIDSCKLKATSNQYNKLKIQLQKLTKNG